MEGLLETESDEECEWMLTVILEAFGEAPDVIFFALCTNGLARTCQRSRPWLWLNETRIAAGRRESDGLH